MKSIILLLILTFMAMPCYSEECPNKMAFEKQGWIIHSETEFDQIVTEKLNEFLPEVGTDLFLDNAESYISEFSHDYYMIMWVVIFDRVSTVRDEMWGDVAFSRTCPYTGEFTEVRWYDPVTQKKHIVFNPEHSCCLTTKVPLAYNTIF